MPLLILNEDELRQTVAIAEAIDQIRASFIALAENRLNIPGDFTMGLPNLHGEVHVHGSYLDEAPYYVVKVDNYFQDNPSINLPPNSGFITVFDAATGFPVAILVDNGYLTRIRAAAAGALTAQYLAKESINKVAVIGTGKQAYIQIKVLKRVRDVQKVVVWGPTPLKTDTYARRIVEDYDLNVEIAETVEEAVHKADLVITVTPSQKPLIKAAWLSLGVHVVAIGSNRPPKQELDIDVLQRADLVVVDDYEQCARRGEIHHALEAGAITREDIHGTLGDLIVGKVKGRTDPDQITVADLTGLEIQDAAIATLALEKALFYGLGQRVEITAVDNPSWTIG